MRDLLKSFVYCRRALPGLGAPDNLSPQSLCAGRCTNACHASFIAQNTAVQNVPVARGLASWLRYLMGLMLVVMSFSAAALNCATPGKDGPGGTLSGVINRYWPGSSSTSNTINLGSSIGNGLGISTGDLLLVIQMQDAAIESQKDDDSYGNNVKGDPASGSTFLYSSGLYEFVRATSNVGIGGGPVTFVGGGGAGLLNAYTSTGQSRFQVVRVPQYTTASIGSSPLTAVAWNGSAGGVLAFDVAGQLTLLAGATVNVNGLGFRGGAARQLSGGAGSRTDYRTSAGVNNNGSKGEGIAGTPRYVNNSGTDMVFGTLVDNLDEGYPSGSHARGAPGNAGGGATDGNPAANDQNTGGGGGSNAGEGGKGGNGWSSASPTGGFGGFGYSSSLTPARLFLGGGGGSGTTNNGTGSPGAGFATSGAAGGGLVMVRAGSITGSSGTISANGSNANNSVTNDGSGGGGAGGSVLVYSNAGGVGLLAVSAKGGNGGTNTGGGSLNGPGTGGGSPHGPGGGGSGGYVVTSSAASVTVSGGAPGTTSDGTNFGATAGTSGTSATVGSTDIPGVKSGAECAIVIVKSFSPNPMTASNTSTLTVKLTSSNNLAITGIVLNDVFPTAPGAMVVSAPLTFTNPSCGGTLLDSDGNSLAAADVGVRLNGGSLAANSSCTFTIKVTVSVAGTYTNTIATGALASTNGGTNANPASDALVVVSPSLVFLKTVSATSDPSNGVTNPKNIPGAEVLYTLRVTNTGTTAADNNSTVITDPIPANTELFVGNLGGVIPGPIDFVQGTPTSALTWAYASLGNTTDDVAFSDSDCITFTYVPVPVLNYDPAVKCIRLNPKGTMATASGGSNPFFELRFRVRIK